VAEERIARELASRARAEASEREACEHREAELRQHEETERRQATERKEREEKEGRDATERDERQERERREADPALTIAGDRAMVGLVGKLVAAYHEAGFKAEITVARLANGADVTAVAEGDYDIGLSARDPIPGDPAGIVFSVIAKEGACVITNNDNPITNMTEETVNGIFTGRLTDWSEVPDAVVTGAIDVFDYEPSPPTQEAFQNIVLGNLLKISSGATGEPSEELMLSAVAGDESGIGFTRIGQAAGVNRVGYEGAPCTIDAARSSQYVAVRDLWLVTKGFPSGESLTFIKWIAESAEARGIIESDWIAV
jgi:phosphate transport system substrate-binding protein